MEKRVLTALAAAARGGKQIATVNDVKKSLRMSSEGEQWKVERAVNNLSQMHLVEKDDISRRVGITKRGMAVARMIMSSGR